ncbi:hypothetical protein ACJ41O_001728 [Fusarium nematophilum]
MGGVQGSLNMEHNGLTETSQFEATKFESKGSVAQGSTGVPRVSIEPPAESQDIGRSGSRDTGNGSALPLHVAAPSPASDKAVLRITKEIVPDVDGKGPDRPSSGSKNSVTHTPAGVPKVLQVSKVPSVPQETPVQPQVDAPKSPTPSASPPPTPAEPPLDLYDEISDKVKENTDQRDFVPADAIAALARRDVVEAELRGKEGDVSLTSLVNYVLDKPAIKVFLTLAYCGYTESMAELSQCGICDEHLPIDCPGKNSTPRSLNPDAKSQPDWAPLLAWDAKKRRDVLDRQWLFLSPVFAKDKFAYQLYKRCPLPIIGKATGHNAGLSGSVYAVELHPAHQKVLNKSLTESQKQGKNQRVALKMIKPQLGHYFKQEEETLGVIREIDNPHLIMPIASYRYHGEENGCFLFPWAEGGNLREFWAKDSTRPLKDPKMMAWVLGQACGLVHALSILHNKKRRHGDIKPENILLFEGAYKGTLRIADVGLAKFHQYLTQQRKDLMQNTNTMTGTIRYVSPEFIHAKVIPRVFDVWALGCVFVEFLIWILYGKEQLQVFNSTSFDHFWEERNSELGSEFVIHSKVKPWLDRLSEDLSGPETALASLLDLVRSKMLVPSEDDRSGSVEVYNILHGVCSRAGEDDGYLLNREIWSRISTRSMPSTRQSGATLDVPGVRARPPAQLPRPQEPTPQHEEDNRPIPIMVHEAEDAPPEEVTMIPSTTKIAQEYVGQIMRLNDVWNSQPDNEFARALFARDDWSPSYPPHVPSKLCQTCAGLDIAQGGFEMGDLLKNINARSKECKLCTLFSEAAAELGMAEDDMFVCQRVESTLRVQPSGRTILSIYSDPDQVFASLGAQIGSPQLPEPGSPVQFALMNEWLRVCRETHNHGRMMPNSRAIAIRKDLDVEILPTERPTRVIDVGDESNPQLRLINCEAMKSREYIALSHCWGQSPTFRALNDNIGSLREGIDFGRLPRNFQDAVTVTRGLNARYLWIDSLCIIQDNKDDWDHEAARMQQVFSNAVCVLAASSAASSAEGFLKMPRQQRTWVTMKSSSSGTIRYVCKFIDNFHRDVEEAVLNKRGEKAAFLGDSDFPNSILPYYKGGRIVLFQNLFRMYSGLNFSRSADRCVAISGLEKRLMAAFKTRGGYGIFELYLARSLLWVRPEGGSLAPIDYLPDRNVPSWSWMTYEGSVTYLEAPFDKVDWTKDYDSPFDIDDGNQDKRYWEANGNNPSPVLRSDRARRLASDQDRTELVESIIFDLEGKDYEFDALRCIIIGRAKPNTSGRSAVNYALVIAPSSKQPDAYVRVGVGSLLDAHVDLDVEESVEVH